MAYNQYLGELHQQCNRLQLRLLANWLALLSWLEIEPLCLERGFEFNAMDLYKIAQWTIAAAQEKNKNMTAFVIVEPFYYFFFLRGKQFFGV